MTRQWIDPDSGVSFDIGSDNVFADLNLPDAEELLMKSKLIHKISHLIQAKGLKQAEVAQRLGIDQPKVSALLHGRLSLFSLSRLIRFANLLNTHVDIVFYDDSTPGVKASVI